MRKVILYALTISFFMGCSNETSNFENKTQNPSEQSNRIGECLPESFDINAGQHILSGNVTVSNNDTHLFVQYNANADWKFTELHLYVGSLNGTPSNNGNPTPGRFPYKTTFNELTSTYTFTIPFDEITRDANGCFIIAAHSNMVKIDSNYQIIQSETGWTGYNDFSGNNWARYFTYCKCEKTTD